MCILDCLAHKCVVDSGTTHIGVCSMVLAAAILTCRKQNIFFGLKISSGRQGYVQEACKASLSLSIDCTSALSYCTLSNVHGQREEPQSALPEGDSLAWPFMTLGH
jgi:hypothetical protein